MNKMNKKFTRLFALAAILLSFTAMSCNNDPDNAEAITLQDIISIAESGSTVNLNSGVFELKNSSKIELSKALTLKADGTQFDFKNAAITVKASGAKIDNVKNVSEIIIDKAVGDGDFTISNSDIKKLTVNGGGANSIHFENSEIETVVVAKENVRVVLEGTTTVAALETSVDCILDSTDKTAVITKVQADDTVKTVTLKGKVTVKTVETTTKDFTITVASNEVSVETTIVETPEGAVSTITLVPATEDIIVPETKLPEGKIESEGKTDDSDTVLTSETEHMKLTAMDDGSIKIDLTGLPTKDTAADVSWSTVSIKGEDIFISAESDLENASATYYWPFTEKDKVYEFTFRFEYTEAADSAESTDSTDDSSSASGKIVKYNETTSIKAKADCKKAGDYINFENLGKIKLSAEYNYDESAFYAIFDSQNLSSYKDVFISDSITNILGIANLYSGKSYAEADSYFLGANYLGYDEDAGVYAKINWFTTTPLFCGETKFPACIWGLVDMTKLQQSEYKYYEALVLYFTLEEYETTPYSILIYSDILEYKPEGANIKGISISIETGDDTNANIDGIPVTYERSGNTIILTAMSGYDEYQWTFNGVTTIQTRDTENSKPEEFDIEISGYKDGIYVASLYVPDETSPLGGRTEIIYITLGEEQED